MEITKNIFAYVSQIRNFNDKVKGFNEKLEQYFSLEFLYFKTKYFFEKNFKANLSSVNNYQKVEAELQAKKTELALLKNSKEYFELLNKTNKIYQTIDSYKNQFALDTISKSKKDELKNTLNKMISFKNKFENDAKNKEMYEKMQKIEQNVQNLEQYLNNNAFFSNIDISSKTEVTDKIKDYFLKKEQVFSAIKEKNMPQENTRLSEIIERVENAQNQNSNIANVILDQRFQLKKMEYAFYLEELKKNLLQITSKNEVGLVEKYIESIKQKFFQLGFEKQESKNDFV